MAGLEASGERSAAVGVNFGVVSTGNHVQITQFFGSGYELLADAYVRPQGLWRELDLNAFTGRDWLIEQVDEFLAAGDRGYLVIEAAAGLGKTTLLAHLASTRGWAHHFVRVAGRPGPTTALRSLAAQLITACRLEEFAQGGTLPAAAGRPDWFDDLLEHAARRRTELGLDHPLTLVVDGLDEADNVGGMPLGLPRCLPPGVHVVASRRPGEIRLPCNPPPRVIRLDAQDARNLEDMRLRLAKFSAEPVVASRLAAANKPAEWLVDTLAERCAGVWIYLHHVTEEIRQGLRRVDALDALPSGLWNYYADTLTHSREVDPAAWEQRWLPLLAALAAAAEPIPFPLLCALAGLHTDPLLRRQLDGPWRPFLLVQALDTRARPAGSPLEEGPSEDEGTESGYAPYHASVRDFLTGQLDPASLEHLAGEQQLIAEMRRATRQAHARAADRYLALWGGLDAGLPHLHRDDRAGVDHGYGLAHLAEHLELAGGRTADLDRLLALAEQTELGWRNLWFAIRDGRGDPAGYLRDVARAQRLAEQDTDARLNSGKPAPSIALEIRYALIQASVANLSLHLPALLPAQLAATHLWTPEQALTYARQIPDMSDRAQALAGLVTHLPDEERATVADEVLRAARDIRDIPGNWERVQERVRALAGLVAQLPAEHRASVAAKALRAAHTIGDDLTRADVLTELAPHLPEQLLGVALQLVREIQDVRFRAEALAGLTPRLPKEQSATVAGEALRAAHDVKHEWQRARALAELAPLLPEQLLGVALQLARGLGDPRDRARALAGLAAHLPKKQRATVTREALRAARDVGHKAEYFVDEESEDYPLEDVYDQSDRAQLLAEVAPHLPKQQRAIVVAEALRAARDIYIDETRAELLTGMLPHLPEEQRATVAGEALQAARIYVESGALREAFRPEEMAEWLTRLLAQLAPYLPKQLLASALQTAHDTGEERALPRLAPYLPKQLLGVALQLARDIDFHWTRARVLTGLAPYVPEAQRATVVGEALQAARDADDDDVDSVWALIRALAELPPLLPKEPQATILGEALDVARAIRADWPRAKLLAELAPQLPEPQRADILAETVSVARGIDNELGKVHLLMELASRLPEAQRATMLAEALQTVCDSDNEFIKADLLAELAPHLPQDLLPSALTAARDVDHDETRAKMLLSLAGHLPVQQRAAVVAEALKAARGFNLEWRQADVLTKLPPQLPLAREIHDVRFRAEALAGLATMLPEEQRAAVIAETLQVVAAATVAEAQEAARGMYSGTTVAQTVAGLATILPEGQRAEVVAEAVQAVRRIPHEIMRVRMLVALAPQVPEVERAPLVEEVLRAGERIADDHDRSEALRALTPYLTGRLYASALRVIRGIRAEFHRSRWLADMAPLLPEQLLESALRIARDIGDDWARAQALAGLAPHLPLQDCAAVLDEASRAGPPHQGLGFDYLQRIVGRCLEVPTLWTHARHVVLRDRYAMLSGVAEWGPLVRQLGGQAAIINAAHAVVDVGRQWP